MRLILPLFNVKKLKTIGHTLILLGAFFFMLNHKSIEAAEQKILPTVKIISHDFTRSGQLVPQSLGSGTLISKDGLILTNSHVVLDDESEPLEAFEVCFTPDHTNGDENTPVCEYTASLIAYNETLDVSLLKLHSTSFAGAPLPTLPFYTVQEQSPVVGEKITVMGYPSTGGESVTVTYGEVSGFEKRGEVEYLKTDTDISPGNSGGTALNSSGKFIGIPTYVISNIENLGYILSTRSLVPWLQEHLNDPVLTHKQAEQLLKKHLTLQSSTEKNGKYLHPIYPKFSFTFPESWKLSTLLTNKVQISKAGTAKNYTVIFQTQKYPVPVTEGLLKYHLFGPLDRQKDDYENFQRKSIEFAGLPAHEVSYHVGSHKAVIIILPYGHALFLITYAVEIKNQSEDLTVYKEIFDSFRLLEKPRLFAISQKEIKNLAPEFSFTAPGEWFALKNDNEEQKTLLYTLAHRTHAEGEMDIFYEELNEGEKNLEQSELLRKVEESKAYSSRYRLVEKNEKVVMDGLTGFSLTYTYEKDQYKTSYKRSEVYIFDGDFYYIFSYEDEIDDYERYAEDFLTLLRSFQRGESAQEFSLTGFTDFFADIRYHRFEREIGDLVSRGILETKGEQYFYPERSITRLDALVMILKAREKFLEKKNDQSLTENIESFGGQGYPHLDFADIQDEEIKKYLRYARFHEIIHGSNNFYPDRSLSLAEGLKIMLKVFEVPVWNPPYQENFPWYKPYLDKSYELGLFFWGTWEPAYVLARGEMAGLIVSLLEEME